LCHPQGGCAQLNGSGVEVLELIPPYVQTHLMGTRQANDPNAMPLDEFIAETMKILNSFCMTL
jgi:uncharacterized oxidoreductase